MRSSPFIALLLLAAAPSTGRAQSISLDSLRRELPLVISVQRLPAGAESVWTALVTPGLETAALGRFNRENPGFLTYLFENATSFDRHVFLRGLPANADAPALFFRRLEADTSFLSALAPSLDRYLRRSASEAAPARPLYSADTLILYATRFFRLETDTAGHVGFSQCAKSWQLQEPPIPTSVTLEAWFFSIVRAGLFGTARGAIMSTLAAALPSAPLGHLSDARQSELQHQMWDALARSEEFRRHVLGEIGRRSSYLPFALRVDGSE